MINWEAFYHACYAILVEHAGAVANEADSFVHHALKDEHPLTEWRFSGKLGFGGKFRRLSQKVYIDCYPEDETNERKAIIQKVNILLGDLMPSGGVYGSPAEHAQFAPRIPKTLEECFEILDEKLSSQDRSYLQDAEDPDAAAVSLHHSLGRYLRNTWGLWGDGSELKRCLREDHGITHPDDMSGFILREYCRARYPTRQQKLMED